MLESPETDLKDYHETWKSSSMNWLYPTGKELNKGYLDPIPKEMRDHYSKSGLHFHLDVVSYSYLHFSVKSTESLLIFVVVSVFFFFSSSFMQIISLLQDCDVRFQLLLTGLHHILNSRDNQLKTEDYEKYFTLHKYSTDIKNYTQMALCEIRTALKKLGAPFPVIIDPTTIKDNEHKFFEWIVFREYLNQLEHLYEVVEVVNQTIDSSHSNNENQQKTMSD